MASLEDRTLCDGSDHKEHEAGPVVTLHPGSTTIPGKEELSKHLLHVTNQLLVYANIVAHLHSSIGINYSGSSQETHFEEKSEQNIKHSEPKKKGNEKQEARGTKIHLQSFP